jgi:flagellar hook-associated protein 1
MGITSVLNIAKNAMSATQTAIQVTSHNVANVNTSGYSRQEAVLTETTPIPTGAGLLGNGVTVETIKRYCNKFLDSAIAVKNSTLQQQKTMATYFEQIQSVLEESNLNLSKTITDFFNSWQDLSTDPTSTSVRTTIVTRGENVCDTVRNVYTSLKDMQATLNSSVGEEISNINSLVSKIADLNQKILDGGVSGGVAGDYVDQRNQLFKELSGMIGVTSIEDEHGRMTVMTTSGKVLVDNTQYWNLHTMVDSDTGYNRIAWEDHSGNLTDITDEISSGSIRSLVQMRDQYIGDGFLEQIDGLAETIIAAVNSIHETGTTLNGTTGILFFEEVTGNYALNMKVSDQVLADVRNVSATSSSDNPTDNDIALQIADLSSSELSINGTFCTISDYVALLTSTIGDLTGNAQDLSTYEQNTMDTLESQRASVSGVSIDEEMANLIKYQYAYQAAARLFSVADELFKSLLGVAS